MINVADEKYIEEVINKNQKVSILTACLNESGSIGKWLDQVSNVIQGTKCNSVKELVIVDDGSKDGTIDIILEKSRNFPIPIKLIRRDVRMGTLNAQIIGSRACSSEYILILDCDLQHPVDFIMDFLEKLEDEPDIIIGSRYMPGGYNKWSTYRGFVSRSATFLSQILISGARRVKDPLSGYFLIKKSLISGLTPYEGMFKPLLYAISMANNPKMIEIPIIMEGRESGVSKIVTNPVKVVLRYIKEILVFFKSSKMKDD